MTRGSTKKRGKLGTPRTGSPGSHRRPGRPGPVIPGAAPPSLRRLALETGLSLSHVSRVFSGKRQPSMRAARLIATALQIDIDSLMYCLPCKLDQVKAA